MKVNMDLIRRYGKVGDKITIRSDKWNFYNGAGLYDGLVMTVSATIKCVSPITDEPIHSILVSYQPIVCKPSKDEQSNICKTLKTNEDGTPYIVERKMNDEDPTEFWLEADDAFAERIEPE